MSLVQVDTGWIENVLAGEYNRSCLVPYFKFILREGPGKQGFVRFSTADFSHGCIDELFLKELRQAGLRTEEYKSRGGGDVQLDGFKPYDTMKGKIYTMSFSGKSVDLGPFDRNLLNAALSQGLNKEKFSLYK